ncbi:MAG TPA: hypothetical protein VD864_11140 [Nocardioides sp.]|nr:hypothetical protein [Nocardioides sp.]
MAPRSPEDGGAPDARGSAGAAQAAPVTVDPSPTTDLSMPPRGRQLAAFVAFAASVLTLIQLAVAYADPGPVTVGVAVVLLATSLACWRLWARRTEVTVVLTGSRLEIVRDHGRHVFDLADTRAPVDVIGLPGDRSWRVLFYRRGLTPYVLDATMVDPAEFLRVLHAHRPEVHYRPR